MKTKTITKIISKKLNEWLETITDMILRDDVKDQLLVSGGSIASMLLKTPVNDFDIYIKDMEVLLKLAKYYCKGKVLDGRKRDEYLKNRFPNIPNDGYIEIDGEKEKYVAEEYVRISNLKKDQVKLDINGAGQRIEQDEEAKYVPVFLSQNAISLKNDIQIVLRFHGSPEQIHETFDYIHATNYFTFKDGLVLNKEALESLITKNLVYQGSLYPVTSIIRMKKFIGRGFTMNAGEVLKVLFQVSALDLTDIEVLEEQLIGVDVAYFSTLIEALRGVEKEKMTPAYMNTMIDRIFSQYEEDYDGIKPIEDNDLPI